MNRREMLEKLKLTFNKVMDEYTFPITKKWSLLKNLSQEDINYVIMELVDKADSLVYTEVETQVRDYSRERQKDQNTITDQANEVRRLRDKLVTMSNTLEESLDSRLELLFKLNDALNKKPG